MKKLYGILIAILLPVLGWTQWLPVETPRTNFFVAPAIEIGEVAGENSLSMIMQGGIRFENVWFGVYDARQYRFCYENALDESCAGTTHYVGVWTGWERPVDETIAVYGGLRAARGLIELEKPNSRFIDADYYEHVLVLTPEVGMTWQFATHVQFAWMVGYRWIDGIEQLPGLEDKDFSSLVSTLSLRFGM